MSERMALDELPDEWQERFGELERQLSEARRAAQEMFDEGPPYTSEQVLALRDLLAQPHTSSES
jgi:hypothetical protein